MPAPPAGISPASCRTARCTSLPTASPSAELAKRDQITLTCSGGTLQRKYGCYVNPALISQLKSLEIDLFIFPAKASTRRALWDSNAFNADFKSILLKRAAQSLLLIDKSKFNRSGEARIGHLDDVTHIVSDAPQPGKAGGRARSGLRGRINARRDVRRRRPTGGARERSLLHDRDTADALDLGVNAVLVQLGLNIGQILRHLFIALFIGSLRLKMVSRHQPLTSHCAISAATFAGFSTISQTIHEMLLRFGR